MGKIAWITLFFSVALLACTDEKGDSIHPEKLIGSWIHSHEDDTEDITVYRPAGYDFPTARGRSGFTLQAGGECTIHNIAPTDGATNEPATWSWEESNTLTIRPKGDGAEVMVMEVVSVSEALLKVKK